MNEVAPRTEGSPMRRAAAWAGLGLLVMAGLIRVGLDRGAAGGCDGSWSTASTGTPPATERWHSMGTFAALSVPAEHADRLAEGVQTVRSIFDDIEAEQSLYRPESWIRAVNTFAGTQTTHPLTLHARTLLAETERGVRHSQGVFDPTVGPLLALWGLRGSTVPTSPPDAAALQAVAGHVGWRRVAWDDQGIRLTAPGMVLDFGGIAKGYAVDQAVQRLEALGWTDFMVDLGGELRCHGSARTGRAGWHVAVRDPWKAYGEGRIGVLRLSGGLATATSGHYERFVEIGGRRYAHIIDPRTQEPAEGMAQVTVVAPNSIEADVLSTALFILGVGPGLDMLDAYPGASALWVLDAAHADQARVYATAGFLEHFEPARDWSGRISTTAPRPRSP